jgi:hypothetical protein
MTSSSKRFFFFVAPASGFLFRARSENNGLTCKVLYTFRNRRSLHWKQVVRPTEIDNKTMKNELGSLLCLLCLSGLLVDAFTTVGGRHPSLSSFSSKNSKHPSLFSVENDDDIQGEEKSARKTGLAKEGNLSKRFATGEELKNLRLDLESLKHNLQWAEALKDEVRIESLEKAIRNGENRDPDLMYQKSLRLIAQAKKMKDASNEEKDALIEKWADVAAAARQCLPQFNLDGLWVGK